MPKSLIELVAKLRELEAKAHYPYLVYVQTEMQTSCACKTDEDARFVSAMRNAAPALLGILGEIRPGDAKKLDAIIEMIDFSIPSELIGVEEGDEMFDYSPGEYQEMIRMKAVLRRYQAMAAKIAEESK
ncbi:MAG: hypothetical protein WC455_31275 [Dehalococcoidia bacterium]|jgi:hypothetical protein